MLSLIKYALCLLENHCAACVELSPLSMPHSSLPRQKWPIGVFGGRPRALDARWMSVGSSVAYSTMGPHTYVGTCVRNPWTRNSGRASNKQVCTAVKNARRRRRRQGSRTWGESSSITPVPSHARPSRLRSCPSLAFVLYELCPLLLLLLPGAVR